MSLTQVVATCCFEVARIGVSASVLGLLLHLFHGLEALSLTQALNAREDSLGSRSRCPMASIAAVATNLKP